MTQKPIEEMTEEEVLELSEEHLDRLVKLRMAEEGIRFIKKPEEPEYEPEPEKDVVGYTCELFKETAFPTREQAMKVLDAVDEGEAFFVTREYKYATDVARMDVFKDEYGADRSGIKKIEAYSPVLAEQSRDVRKRNRTLEDDYNEKTREYERHLEAVTGIRDEVYGRWYSAKKALSERIEKAHQFVEYMDLADGQEELAIRFYKKAYSPSDEDLEWVLDYVRKLAEEAALNN